MSKFLEECAKMLKEKGDNVLRLSEQLPGGEIETLELVPSNRCQDIYSGAKAFTMTAIGILCDDGVLSVDDKITDIFADKLPDNIDPRWEKATVEHAILHTVGFPSSFMDIDTDSTLAFGRDHFRNMFSVPLAYVPGEGRIYTDASHYLLSRVVTEKTGMRLDDFLWERLFAGLGFLEAAWSRCPMGYPVGGTGLYIHSSDMIKLPILYRDGGVYGGKRYLSEDWVNTVLRKEYCFEWDKTGKVFFKGGMNGQKMLFNKINGRAVSMQSYGANSDHLAVFAAEYTD